MRLRARPRPAIDADTSTPGDDHSSPSWWTSHRSAPSAAGNARRVPPRSPASVDAGQGDGVHLAVHRLLPSDLAVPAPQGDHASTPPTSTRSRVRAGYASWTPSSVVSHCVAPCRSMACTWPPSVVTIAPRRRRSDRRARSRACSTRSGSTTAWWPAVPARASAPRAPPRRRVRRRASVPSWRSFRDLAGGGSADDVFDAADDHRDDGAAQGGVDPDDGGARPSSAACTARNAAGVLHDRGVLVHAVDRDRGLVGAGIEMLVAGTTTFRWRRSR